MLFAHLSVARDRVARKDKPVENHLAQRPVPDKKPRCRRVYIPAESYFNAYPN